MNHSYLKAFFPLCLTSIILSSACTSTTGANNQPANPQVSSSPQTTPAPTSTSNPINIETPNPQGSTNPEPTANPTSIPPGSPAPNQPSSAITSLVLNTALRYLSAAGETAQLSFTAKDKDGNPITLTSDMLSFSSSRPQDFSVDSNGLVKALVAEGFSDITVTDKQSGLSATILLSVQDPDLYSSSGGGSSSSTPSTATQKVTAEVGFEGLDPFANPGENPG